MIIDKPKYKIGEEVYLIKTYTGGLKRTLRKAIIAGIIFDQRMRTEPISYHLLEMGDTEYTEEKLYDYERAINICTGNTQQTSHPSCIF